MQRPRTSFLLDLDGTLVDDVYQHVLAWHEALETEGINLSIWRIHRKVGMSGGLFTNMFLRETGQEINPERVERPLNLHSAEACVSDNGIGKSDVAATPAKGGVGTTLVKALAQALMQRSKSSAAKVA
jgi:phosphoglycolate phosphatase-like HAD superfamily hydrolase